MTYATLAIDIGTYSIRAAIISAQGEIVSIAQAPLSLEQKADGTIEQNGDDIVAATKKVISEVLGNDSSQTAKLTAAIAIQRSTVVCWDAKTGKAVSPAISWQDRREEKYVHSLMPHAKEIQNISKLVLSPHYGASKLRWLNQKYGNEQRYAGPLISFILFNLLESDALLCDESNAARTQLWDVQQRCWSPKLCELFDVDIEQLPTVKPVKSVYGKLIGSAIPVHIVCGDQTAAYQGLAINSDNIIVNAGTGAFVLAKPSDSSSGNLLTSLSASDENSIDYLTEGCVNGCASAVEWFCQSENISQTHFFEVIETHKDQASKIPLFLNGIGGLASPWWYATAFSKFVYSGPKPSLESKCLAVVESIAFLIVKNIHTMKLPESSVIRISGGLSNCSYLCQCISDVSNKQVLKSENAEATLLGLAKLNHTYKSHSRSKLEHYSPREDRNLLNARYALAISAYEEHLCCH